MHALLLKEVSSLLSSGRLRDAREPVSLLTEEPVHILGQGLLWPWVALGGRWPEAPKPRINEFTGFKPAEELGATRKDTDWVARREKVRPPSWLLAEQHM